MGVCRMARREISNVVTRMYGAGWPTPMAIATCPAYADRARDNWIVVIEGLAKRYLSSSELSVGTLISLGPLCDQHLSKALDLAGWDPEPYNFRYEADDEDAP